MKFWHPSGRLCPCLNEGEVLGLYSCYSHQSTALGMKQNFNRTPGTKKTHALDWNQTTYGLPSPYEQGKAGMILPIALQHLCPAFVSVIGMGTLAAAVMSSVDSVLLSAASQIARNIYKNIIYKQASERSIVLVMRVSIFLCGLVGALLASTSSSVVLFWIFSADLLYSIMTPQVVCTLFLSQWVNRYGAISGFVLGFLLRTLVGDSVVGLPSVLPLPGDKTLEDGNTLHLFPFRTAIALISFGTILVVSQLSNWIAAKVEDSKVTNIELVQTKDEPDETRAGLKQSEGSVQDPY